MINPVLIFLYNFLSPGFRITRSGRIIPYVHPKGYIKNPMDLILAVTPPGFPGQSVYNFRPC